MKIKILFSLSLFFVAFPFLSAFSKSGKPEFFEIRIYHLENKDQEYLVDNYLKNALLPALHRNKIDRVGAFKPLGNDTASIRRIFLIIPYGSLKEFTQVSDKLLNDKQYEKDGRDYIDAPHNQAPYKRIESIMLRAFSDMPVLEIPKLKAARSQRIYEMRSYESATEKLHRNKVHMFNEGGEMHIFKRLGFNAVFYGEVLAGARKPNLIYMTSFESKPVRDSLWKSFGKDSEWKKLKEQAFYKNNMNKSETVFLTSLDYSDI